MYIIVFIAIAQSSSDSSIIHGSTRLFLFIGLLIRLGIVIISRLEST